MHEIHTPPLLWPDRHWSGPAMQGHVFASPHPHAELQAIEAIVTFPHLLRHGSRSALLSWLGPVVMIGMNSMGVRCPMALCVRSSLYSLRQASITTCASCTVRNQCSFKHSSRNFPLKLSIKAF